MLTIKELVRANREAIANGTLQAVNPDQSTSICAYSGPCAIGVMLPPSVRLALDRADGHNLDMTGTDVEELVKYDLLETENNEVFEITQRIHDAWQMNRRPQTFPRIVDLGRVWLGFNDNLPDIQNPNQATFESWLDYLERTYLS